MAFPKVYLSRPGVHFPTNTVTNEQVLARIKEGFTGSEREWKKIEASILRVFDLCGTSVRYLEDDPQVRVADHGITAACNCLETNNLGIEDVDVIINGSIARDYFEPSTAMEIAAGLGKKECHAFDVTSACVGAMEALQVGCAYLNMHEQYRCVMVCASELTRDHISYDIQSTKDLYLKSAGFTIGNAAACWLVSRAPFTGGCLELSGMHTYSLPKHWNLCYVPVDGTFTSSSTELFKLSRYVVPQLKKFLDRIGWIPDDVDHYLFHQPSEKMLAKIVKELGADPSKLVLTHNLYGNNASATVTVVMNQLCKEGRAKQGDKMILCSAAAGFTMVTGAGQWLV